jgi:two-component system sensor histidine kinase/response regulator
MPVVLLVDDNKLNQLVAKGTLKRLNYAVEIVDSGADAVRACALRGYDAVLMDIMMPGMDGFEATARIRAVDATHPEARHTPIIGLSARAMEGDREQALAAGLDDYLTKPVREDELKAALERWIRPVAVLD